MTILIINGPNLNFLGQRDKTHYGIKTLDEISQMLQNKVYKLNNQIKLNFFQSNHEGAIIDFIQEHRKAAGLVINPGALSHYSYAVADALRDFPGLKVEVHLSDINKREDWRVRRVTARACDQIIVGKKELGYLEALEWLLKNIG